MTKKVIAHFTDAHLGQKLAIGGGIAGDKMRYDYEPEEHETNLRLVLDDIEQKGVSELIFGGDIGASEHIRTFFELLGAHGFTASLILGNHDVFADVAEYRSEGVYAVGGKMCYSRDDGSLKYVFLDTSDNTVGGEQLAWLERELKGASKVALFLHHPILDIDTPVERAGAILRDRDELKMILTRTRCDISTFCGHYHMEDEASGRPSLYLKGARPSAFIAAARPCIVPLPQASGVGELQLLEIGNQAWPGRLPA
ncbi:metallophosphoesterase [Bradyrhizobium sp. ARR65]|uniref:metallophosphoesterase family protein n=1 Tax=Bradyrhizobium sp. ARR65 TaxID=1040989 RepID=UPI00046419F0|nr:metallophosphoesterase [Bradyrhizobium sp. ARR65]